MEIPIVNIRQAYANVIFIREINIPRKTVLISQICQNIVLQNQFYKGVLQSRYMNISPMLCATKSPSWLNKMGRFIFHLWVITHWSHVFLGLTHRSVNCTRAFPSPMTIMRVGGRSLAPNYLQRTRCNQQHFITWIYICQTTGNMEAILVLYYQNGVIMDVRVKLQVSYTWCTCIPGV